VARILVIGPHPDDQEIGMGGTVAALAAQGHDVLLLDMTDGCPTPRGDRTTRLREAAAAAAALGPAGEPVKRVLLDLPNRAVQHTIEARHKTAGVIRAHRAQVLFMPHPVDAHPDHTAVTRIAEDARFDAKLTKIEMPAPPGYGPAGPPIYPRWVFYYFCSHLRRLPEPHFVFDTSAHAASKRRALEAYESQFGAATHNAGVIEWVAQRDAAIGSLIGAACGEAFWTKEPLGLSSLAALPL